MTQKAYIGIPVPLDIGRRIHTFAVPGKKEDPTDSHITLAYMGEVEEDALAKAMLVLLDYCPRVAPFTVVSNKVTNFPANEDGMPIICEVDSPPIHAFHQQLCLVLDQSEVPYSKKYPIFKPHITVAYDEESRFNHDLSISPPIEFLADRVFLRIGGRDNDQADLEFRLGPNQNATVAKILKAAATLLRG